MVRYGSPRNLIQPSMEYLILVGINFSSRNSNFFFIVPNSLLKFIMSFISLNTLSVAIFFFLEGGRERGGKREGERES